MPTIRNLGGAKAWGKLKNTAANMKAKGKPGHKSYTKATDLMMKQIKESTKGLSNANG